MPLLLRTFFGGSLALSEDKKPTTSAWPRCDAASKAVAPLSLVLSMSTPDSTSNRPTSRYPLLLQGAKLLTHPLADDPCCSRLQAESGRCQDGQSELRNEVVLPQYPLSADSCRLRLQQESGRRQDGLLEQHNVVASTLVSCLLHFCLRLPRSIGAWVRYAPPMQLGVGEVSRHFHLKIISPLAFWETQAITAKKNYRWDSCPPLRFGFRGP